MTFSPDGQMIFTGFRDGSGSYFRLIDTVTGKIVRRLIRLKYLGEPLGDTSTVQNPAALDQFEKAIT